METFPQVDNEFMLIKAGAIAENGEEMERAHTMAERSNQLFAFSHVALAATARNLFSEREYSAFVSGIRAYEIIGLGELDPDRHARYSTDYAFNVLAQTERDGNFDIHFLEEIEHATGAMEHDTPWLTQAVEALAHAELHDSSPELGRFALCGAAAIRDGQIEIDQLLVLEDMFES